LVLFEVPDVGRILRERAFWDIYYEHCSYFTAGSLAGLFRRVGFEVLDVEHAFGGQYLLLLARPAGTEVESSQGPVNDHRSHDGLKVDARPLAGARGSDPLIPLARARGSDRLASLACASGSK